MKQNFIFSFFLILFLSGLFSGLYAQTVHTIGDSTMEQRDPTATEFRGWAQMLGVLFFTIDHTNIC